MFLEDRWQGAKPCSALGISRLEELIRAPAIHSETLKQTQLNTKPSFAPCECLCPHELLSVSVQAARELPSWCRRSLLAPFIADNPAPFVQRRSAAPTRGPLQTSRQKQSRRLLSGRKEIALLATFSQLRRLGPPGLADCGEVRTEPASPNIPGGSRSAFSGISCGYRREQGAAGIAAGVWILLMDGVLFPHGEPEVASPAPSPPVKHRGTAMPWR